MEKEKIWQIICLVLVVIIIGLSVYAFGFRGNNNINKSNNQSNNQSSDNSISEDERNIMIRLDEDFSVDGTIKNLENVRWNNARIMQMDGKLELDIMLNNELKDKKIEARTLTVKLLDKAGKEIATKDFEMKEIKDNYGYTNIELTFDIPDPVIVGDIEITAKEK